MKELKANKMHKYCKPTDQTKPNAKSWKYQTKNRIPKCQMQRQNDKTNAKTQNEIKCRIPKSNNKNKSTNTKCQNSVNEYECVGVWARRCWVFMHACMSALKVS